MVIRKIFLTLLSLSFGASSSAWAAPCCGGHVALPSLLSGYEHYRFNSSFSVSRIIGDAPEHGVPVFRKGDDQAQSQTFSLSASALLSDRFQVGFSFPISLNTSKPRDLELSSALEVGNLKTTHALHPRFYFFQQLSVPTGTSIYESSDLSRGDVTGTGFVKTSMGLVALGTRRKWDGFTSMRIGYNVPREFGDAHLRVSPGGTADIGVGLGYSLTGSWRIGGSIQALVNEARVIENKSNTMTSSSTLVWPIQLQVAWFRNSNSTFDVSYLDETLIGPVKNTTLSRALHLSFSYRWASGG